MVELLGLILSVWLLWKILGLIFRMAWGTAKFAVSVLISVASVALVCCLLFAGGVLILIPVALLAAAFGILKRVV